MVAMIIQLLPESSTNVIQVILGLIPLSLFSSVQKGRVVDTDEMEVKVGVPKF